LILKENAIAVLGLAEPPQGSTGVSQSPRA